MRISETGINFIKRFEGLRLKSYLCSGGVATIAWGTTVYPDGTKVQLGQSCTKEDAERYLDHDMKNIYEKHVVDSVAFPLITKQCEFDALVSFVYNVGRGGLHAPNSVDRRLKNGENFHKVIREELPRWNKAGGKVSAGLVRRRKEELELFFSSEGEKAYKINFGVVSNEVKLFQKMINCWLEHWEKQTLIVDGVFGKGTLQAVNDFERNNKLKVSEGITFECWKRVENFYNKEQDDHPAPAPKPEEKFFRWKRGETKQLTDNFSAEEFQCKCGYCDEQKIEKELVERLQKLRERLGKSIHITSGYRCSTHNANVGGVPNSRHAEGDAADIFVSGVSPSDLSREWQKLGFGDGGIGVYSSFTHVDTRGYIARWWG